MPLEIPTLVQAIEQHVDDPFVLMDAVRWAAMHTETEIYGLLRPQLRTEEVAAIEAMVPWVVAGPRRAPPVEHTHCACGIHSDVRWDYDEAVCFNCGVSSTYLVHEEQKDPFGEMRERPRLYSRANRFRTILHRFVDGCRFKATHTDLAAIASSLPHPQDADAGQVRRALRKLKLGRLYSGVPGIVGQLREEEPPSFTTSGISVMRHLFGVVDARMQCDGRKYMPSYLAILAMLMAHMGLGDEARVYVPGLAHRRTRERVHTIMQSMSDMLNREG